MVTVKLTAKGELKGVKIDDSLLKPDEKEIVEDLLVAAHADARRKAEAVMQDKMKSLTGGLSLPPGMKLLLRCMHPVCTGMAVEPCLPRASTPCVRKKGVDGRDKPGHDEYERPILARTDPCPKPPPDPRSSA